MLFFMADVVVYSTTSCGYCVRAKALARASSASSLRRSTSRATADKRAWLVQTTGRRTVPQIFIKGKAIGGFDDLAALNASGELVSLAAEIA